MRLSEPDSAGDAGIDIAAQPPGKRLQNVLLLSGGEKALTALALLIAIFRYQPSPFCILDEVDAPLDETNVGRFAQMVSEMSGDAQFIVVTHNRRTMEMASGALRRDHAGAGRVETCSVNWEQAARSRQQRRISIARRCLCAQRPALRKRHATDAVRFAIARLASSFFTCPRNFLISFFFPVDIDARCARIRPLQRDWIAMASPQMSAVVWETNFPGLKLLSRGKVRDLYEVGGDLLLVATDRLSAFDVVLPTPIPDKGRVLTQLSLFWFETLRDVVPNHVLSGERVPGRGERLSASNSPAAPCSAARPSRCPSSASCAAIWPARDGRTIARRAKSAASPCRRGCANPTGCRQPFSRRPPRPPRATTKIFPLTRRSRASAARAPSNFARSVWKSTAAPLRMPSRAGYLLADTKFEFGLIGDELIWIDEALTPDSSRFWPAAGYAPGQPQPSFDKQYVRDYLERIGWNKQPPGPELPAGRGGRDPGQIS